jgi:hypothetical protein
MSAYATESSLDNFAALGQSAMLAFRAYRLRERAERSDSPDRARMLGLMSEAYIARGLAVEHRMAGSVERAIRLETQSDRLIEDARILCAR